jgi:GAF domain-containing protein
MGRATEIREPIQIPDIAQPDAYQSGVRDALIRFGYRALLSVPLLREDQIIGSLSLNRKAPGAFPPAIHRRPEDLRDAVGVRHRERPTVSRDRGQEPAA